MKAIIVVYVLDTDSKFKQHYTTMWKFYHATIFFKNTFCNMNFICFHHPILSWGVCVSISFYWGEEEWLRDCVWNEGHPIMPFPQSVCKNIMPFQYDRKKHFPESAHGSFNITSSSHHPRSSAHLFTQSIHPSPWLPMKTAASKEMMTSACPTWL